MGRLLKKKTSAKQKRKKPESDSAISGVSNGEATAASPAGAVLKRAPQKKPVPMAKAPVAKGDKNFIGKSVQFLKEVKVELKKVTWPSRKQAMGSTVVVIVVVIIISLFLGVVDIGLSHLVKMVLQ